MSIDGHRYYDRCKVQKFYFHDFSLDSITAHNNQPITGPKIFFKFEKYTSDVIPVKEFLTAFPRQVGDLDKKARLSQYIVARFSLI
jgi:hypothetical protein